MARTARLPSATYIPWHQLLIIGGAMLAFLAWATQSLSPSGVWGSIVRLLIPLGGGIFAGGVAVWITARRNRARGLRLTRGGWEGYGRWAIAGLLLLTLLFAMWPMRPGLDWLGTVLSVLCVGGAVAVGVLLARNGTPLAFREAQRAYQRGDDRAALAALEIVERERPDYHGSLQLRALLHRQCGDHEYGRAAAERLIDLRPDLYFGHAELGLTLVAEGRAPEARPALERAVALAPGLAEAHHNLGMACAELFDHQAAVASLSHALRLGLRDEVAEVIARYRLSEAFAALGHVDRAHAEGRRLRRRRGVLRRWREELAAMPSGQSPRRPSGRIREAELIATIERAIDRDAIPS